MTMTPLLPNDSVVKIFLHRVKGMGPQIAMRQKVLGLWKPVSWTRYGARARGLGLGLVAEGLGRQDRVVIAARPSPTWMMAEMGVLAMGGISVPVDPAAALEQVVHILRDCGASFCLVENWAAAADVYQRREDVPALQKIIVLSSEPAPPSHDPMILSLRALFISGHQSAGVSAQKTWEASIDETQAQDVALLVYAPNEDAPSGAMITHDNLVFQMMAAQTMIPIDTQDRVMSCLNPAEMTRHLLDVFYHLVFGFTLYFPESPASIRRDAVEMMPTICLAPVQNWQDLQEEVNGLISTAPAPQRLVVKAANALGRKRLRRQMKGRGIPLWLRGADSLFRPLVHRPMRRFLGLSACRLALGQADSQATDIDEWAQILGLEWAWALGQGETTGLTYLRVPGRRNALRDGPVHLTQHRTASDGTLLVKGRHVCRGTWPVLNKEDDWFATNLKKRGVADGQ